MTVLARERASFFAFNVLLEMVIEPKIMYRSMTSDVNGGTSRVVKKAEERYRAFDGNGEWEFVSLFLRCELFTYVS